MRAARVRRVPALVALSFVAAALACDSTGVPTSPAPIPAVAADDPEYQRLLQLGYSARDIRVDGDAFVVEGDMVWTREAVAKLPRRAPRPQADPRFGPLFQYQAGATTAWSRVQSIRVNLSGWGGRPDLQTAARAAMNEWNAIGSTAVRFVERTDFWDVRVDFIDEACAGGCVVARAQLPDGYNPGGVVWWNRPADDVITQAGQRTYVLMHEFGHIIGFQHSNSPANEPGGAYLIYGTPDRNDPEATASVMFSAGGGRVFPNQTFTSWDRFAARQAYPDTGPVPFGSVSGGHPMVYWNAQSDAVQYAVIRVEPTWDEHTGMYIDGYSYIVGYTTGTSLVDNGRTTTGVKPCADWDIFYYVSHGHADGTWSYGSGSKVCFN